MNRAALIFLIASIAGAQSAVPVGPLTTSVSNGPILLPNPLALSVQSIAIGTGDVDLYTVPTGRAAIFGGMNIWNNACGSATTAFAEVKIGSTYYQISALKTPASNANSTINSIGYVAAAGQKLAINNTVNACVTVSAQVIEFDAGSNIKSAVLTTLAAGYNTLYTVPAGKSAILVDTTLAETSGTISYSNNSGTTRAIVASNVVSGGTASAANQIQASQNITNTSFGTISAVVTMGAGDFISFNTDANTAIQFAWVTLVEF